MKKYKVKINNKVFNVVIEEVQEIEGTVKEENKVEKIEKVVSTVGGTTDVVAPIQGNVIDVLVKANDKVKKLCNDLIDIERELREDLREYL